MKGRQILFTVIFSLILTNLFSQNNKSTSELTILDNSFFKWKDFSFIQPWTKVKKLCNIEKIETYPDDYLNVYIGNISILNKSYILNNKSYHEFNGTLFDQVVLQLVGLTNSDFNSSSLYFIKKISESSNSNITYSNILRLFKSKYGNNQTTQYNSSSETIFETEWEGKNIHLTLSYIQERNLIILHAKEYATDKIIHSNARNWFFESKYDENFTNTFKEFDIKNGFKGLKFGMLKLAVKKIVKYNAPDVLKKYLVTTKEYKNWFYIPFDFCYLEFNKKNQLYDVSLSKDEYSNDDYEKFLNDITEMFGEPTTYKEKKGDLEVTLWKGKKLDFFIMRPEDKSIYIDFICVGLDDTTPTDKLN